MCGVSWAMVSTVSLPVDHPETLKNSALECDISRAYLEFNRLYLPLLNILLSYKP